MVSADHFISAIAASPYDDAVRLQYADWLEEQGDEQHARFIRVQIALEPIRYRFEDPLARDLHKQENELIGEQQGSELTGLPDDWDGPAKGSRIKFRRGFPAVLYISASNFLEDGAQILTALPTIYRVEIHWLEKFGAALAECKALQRVTELSLSCWYSDEDARAFAATRNLQQLRVLCIWLGRQKRLRDRRLIEIMAGTQAWPNLSELTLLDPLGREAPHASKYVKFGNRTAKRDISRFTQGFPDTYLIDPDCDFLFPGRLPTGELALSIVDVNDPKFLCTITFDETGVQTGNVIRTPLPPNLKKASQRELERHHESLRDHLMAEIGQTSDYIRVQDFTFPFDSFNDFSPAPQHGIPYGQCDGDFDAPWLEYYPSGIGSLVSETIELGEYSITEDYCANRTGRLLYSDVDEPRKQSYY